MTHPLLALQPKFEIRVDMWRGKGKVDVQTIIRRADYWGTADENVPVSDLMADGTVPVVVLEFYRRCLVYTNYWREVQTESHEIRVLANDVTVAMDRAVEWINANPQYRETEFTDAEKDAFKETKKAEELAELYNRSN